MQELDQFNNFHIPWHYHGITYRFTITRHSTSTIVNVKV